MVEKKNFKDKLNLQKLDLQVIANSHINKLEDSLTIHYSKENKDWEILPHEKTNFSVENIQNLSLLCYNVWHGTHNYTERVKEIRKMFITLNPDIICIQEATEKFQNLMMMDHDFAQRYYVSGNSFKQIGVLILSKHPFKCHEMQYESNMFRQTSIFNNETNTHLESNKDQAEARQKQLQNAFLQLKDYENVLFCGSFNLCSQEEEIHDQFQNFEDAWQKVNSMENAGTMINNSQDRSDRILIRKGSKFSIPKIELCGKEPLAIYKDQKPEEDEITTASDHLGLLCQIEFSE